MSTVIIYLVVIDLPEGRHKFEFIYSRHKNLMFHMTNKISGDTRDSEGTVHNASLRVIETIDDITDVGYSQTKSLVATTTENKAIDLYRKRRKRKITPFEEEHLGVPDRSELDSIEDDEALAKAVASLSEKYRGVLFLKYSHGYFMGEIALILPMSRKNVKRTIQRARKKLE